MIIKNKPLRIKTLPSIFSHGDFKITFNFAIKKDEEIRLCWDLTNLVSSRERVRSVEIIDQLTLKIAEIILMTELF